jgi:hypothetical protein
MTQQSAIETYKLESARHEKNYWENMENAAFWEKKFWKLKYDRLEQMEK